VAPAQAPPAAETAETPHAHERAKSPDYSTRTRCGMIKKLLALRGTQPVYRQIMKNRPPETVPLIYDM
jgi:hypothetical protein